MKNQIDPNNPPAFPCPAGHVECYHPVGITIRDYFAAKAMQSLIINDYTLCPEVPLSARAYEIADAMLKRREEP